MARGARLGEDRGAGFDASGRLDRSPIRFDEFVSIGIDGGFEGGCRASAQSLVAIGQQSLPAGWIDIGGAHAVRLKGAEQVRDAVRATRECIEDFAANRRRAAGPIGEQRVEYAL